jgi:hypothetical protein
MAVISDSRSNKIINTESDAIQKDWIPAEACPRGGGGGNDKNKQITLE